MAIAYSNWRILPPPTGPFSFTTNGRTYSCALGSAIDVPDCDAAVLCANGWTFIARSGPTSARTTVADLGSTAPSLRRVDAGAEFYDTTIAQLIRWDGATWRSAAGVAV